MGGWCAVIEALLDQDVTLLAYDSTATDAWGNEQPDWVLDGTYRGRLEHTTSQEIAYAGETTVTDWQLFLGPSVPITAKHRVEVAGRQFRVVGEPAPARDRDSVHHLEVRLVAVEEAVSAETVDYYAGGGY